MYSVANDLYQRFGTKNVRLWADLDNDQVTADIDERIEWAIGQADAQINSILGEKGRYMVPIVLLDSTDTPNILTEISAALAGVRLYEARGIADFDPNTGQPIHRLIWHKRFAEDSLKKIIKGDLVLGAVLRTNVATLAPEVVSDTIAQRSRIREITGAVYNPLEDSFEVVEGIG